MSEGVWLGLHERGRAFNPPGKQHAQDTGHHAGDLPKFDVSADGHGKVLYCVPDVTLDARPHSVFHTGVTALVIHGTADAYKSDPPGTRGGPVACVIEKAAR